MTEKKTPVSDAALVEMAKEAMMRAYAPYSLHYVGAALLCDDGRVFCGCNIENAAYSPSICAERTALAKAVSEGARHFSAIAVVGGREGVIRGTFPPCGVCRQVLAEFCDPASFRVILGTSGGYEVHTLGEVLPYGFFPSALENDG